MTINIKQVRQLIADMPNPPQWTVTAYKLEPPMPLNEQPRTITLTGTQIDAILDALDYVNENSEGDRKCATSDDELEQIATFRAAVNDAYDAVHRQRA